MKGNNGTRAKKPWAESKSEPPVGTMQIKYIWETSIPNSWIKIKGQSHFQRHHYQLSYDSLPSFEKLKIQPAQTPPPPIHFPAKRSKKQFSPPRRFDLPKKQGVVQDEMPDLEVQTRRSSVLRSFLITGLPSLRHDQSQERLSENSSVRNLPSLNNSITFHQRSAFFLTNDSPLLKQSMPEVNTPASSKLQGLRRLYKRVVIANPQVNLFMSRFEKKKPAKIAKMGRKGFLGLKLKCKETEVAE